jgi:glycosyltransferase involved in cell wall biosynthesis
MMREPVTERRSLIDVVIPARNAAQTLGRVLQALPRRELRSVVVVDRGSSDRTAEVARDAGAVVLRSEAGLGAANLRALEHFAALPQSPDVVGFVPADDAEAAAGLPLLYEPILERGVELCVGVREKSRLAERVVTGLIEAVYRQRVAGLGAVRAIRYAALVALGMRDRSAGWDIEMIIRAAKLGLSLEDVPLVGASAGKEASRRLLGRALFHIARHSTMR